MSQRAWIVVADRRSARFFFHGGPGEPLRGVGPGTVEFPRASEDADRPGRVHERSGTGRHAIEAKRPRDEAQLEIAGRAIASALTKGADGNEFDRVLIASPPALIGSIRSLLSKTTSQREVLELPHRLNQLDERELAARLDREGVLGRVAS